MTFIASVIAKEGIAIVADSFVTTVEQMLDQEDLIDHLDKKKKVIKDIPIKEVVSLFKKRPSFTRNYMDKLFQFGIWSAITTTGQAYINKKLIKDLVKEIEVKLAVDTPAYDAKDILDIIKEFCDLLKDEVILHLADSNITETAFIFSYYNRIKDEAQVFNIKVNSRIKGVYPKTSHELVSFNELSHLKIVSDGQDAFIDRLIFGSLYRKMPEIKDSFLDYIFKQIQVKKIKKAAIKTEVEKFDFLKDVVLNDLYSTKFRELSLQEAVDFAALLVRIVMDIQMYTEKIPTVGGLIRIATISKEGKGFRWVTGDKIVIPRIIL